MAEKTLKHGLKVWVVTWPRGTTKEYKEEAKGFMSPPVDFLPIGTEPMNRFTYFDKQEKRTVYGSPAAVFFQKEEAEGYESAEGNYFIIREGYLEVF